MSTLALIGARFKTRPYDHQIKEFEEYCDAEARAKAWTMRSGKSKASVDKACHLYSEDKIDGVLVIAPNGVHANWLVKEFPKHAWGGVDVLGFIWRTSETGWLAEGKDHNVGGFSEWISDIRMSAGLAVLSINCESMTRKDVRKAVAWFLKYRRAVFCIVDESDDFGTPGSIRTKMVRALARRCAYREIDSGTLATSSPLATFSQYEILEKGALGFERFGDFQNRYAVFEQKSARGRTFSAVAGYRHQDELRERLAKYTSVITRDMIRDMPALVSDPIHIEPTPQQLDAYRQLYKDFIIAVEDETIDVGERAARFIKMQQVFSGFVIDNSRTVRELPGGNPRLDALSREVFLTPGKAIVWCAFQHDIDSVKARLLADGHRIVEYHGRVTDKDKASALTTFMEKPERDAKVLVGHLRSCGRGLDLSVAQRIFNYSHTWSARLLLQGIDRATKIGARNITITDFIAPGPDERILKTTQNRVAVADVLIGTGLKNFLQGLEL